MNIKVIKLSSESRGYKGKNKLAYNTFDKVQKAIDEAKQSIKVSPNLVGNKFVLQALATAGYTKGNNGEYHKKSK